MLNNIHAEGSAAQTLSRFPRGQNLNHATLQPLLRLGLKRIIITLPTQVPGTRNPNEMHAIPRQNLHILSVAKRADWIWVTWWYVPGSGCPLELELIFPKAMPARRPKESAFEALALIGRKRELRNIEKKYETYMKTNRLERKEGIELLRSLGKQCEISYKIGMQTCGVFSELALEGGNGYEDSKWSRLFDDVIVHCTHSSQSSDSSTIEIECQIEGIGALQFPRSVNALRR